MLNALQGGQVMAEFRGVSPAERDRIVQAAIRDAAIAIRDSALAEHPSDAEASAEWCAAGGTVVLAGRCPTIAVCLLGISPGSSCDHGI
jgi:hypothetical protein